MPQRVAVEIEGRRVFVRAWRPEVTGPGDHTVTGYLLDRDVRNTVKRILRDHEIGPALRHERWSPSPVQGPGTASRHHPEE